MHGQEPDWPNDTADAVQAALTASWQQVEQLTRDHLLAGEEDGSLLLQPTDLLHQSTHFTKWIR
jgi:hypothetical protein